MKSRVLVTLVTGSLKVTSTEKEVKGVSRDSSQFADYVTRRILSFEVLACENEADQAVLAKNSKRFRSTEFLTKIINFSVAGDPQKELLIKRAGGPAAEPRRASSYGAVQRLRKGPIQVEEPADLAEEEVF